MDPEIVNTAKRRDFIFDIFIPLIKEYEKKLNTKIYISGNALYKNIKCSKHSR